MKILLKAIVALAVLAAASSFAADVRTFATLEPEIVLFHGSEQGLPTFHQVGDRVLASFRDLWLTDGSPAGTQAIFSALWRAKILGQLGERVLFHGGEGVKLGLWSFDSSSHRVVFLAPAPDSITAAPHPSDPTQLVVALCPTRTSCSILRTDGTLEGTAPLANLGAPGRLDGAGFRTLGDHLYLIANDTLWKTAGTQQTTKRVRRFGSAGTLASTRSTLFFTASTAPATATGVWASDGTAKGTRRISQWGGGTGFLTFPDRAFFTGPSLGPTSPHFMWMTQGTPETTVRLEIGEVSSLRRVATLNGKFYLTTSTTVWELAGNTLTPFNNCPGSCPSNPSIYGTVADRLLFVGSDGSEGGLFASNGTSESVARIAPAPNEQPFGDSATKPSLLLFSTQDGVWRTNGRATGTFPLLTGTNTRPTRGQRLGQSWWFGAQPAPSFGMNSLPAEIWTSNGTRAGTRKRVTLPNTGAPPALFVPWGPTALGRDTIVYCTWDRPHPRLLARRRDSTLELRRLDPSQLCERPQRAGDMVFFKGNADAAWWATDGTVDGTRPVLGPAREIKAALAFPDGHRAVVQGDPYGNPAALLKFDRGTYSFTQVATFASIDTPSDLRAVGTLMTFESGRQTWRSDLTPEGTWPIPGLDGLNDVRLETFGNDTFALRGGATLSIWRVPNTREGALEPLPITGLNEGGVRIVGRVAAGVLVTSRVWPAEKLWIFDGSLTVRQVGLLPRVSKGEVEAGGERVFFRLEEAGLWSSDGTAEGTLQVDSRPIEMRSVLPGGRLIYLSWDPGSGEEHWTSEGSLAGTTLLDLVPGPGSVHREIGLASSEAAYLFAPGNDSRELLQITAD